MFTEDTKLILNIINDKGINQQTLSDQLGVSKQFISQIVNGKRGLGSKARSELKRLYPTYFIDSSFDLPIELTKDALISFRNHYKLSQDKLASILGISQSLYAKLETGERNITFEIAERLKTYNANPNVKNINVKPTRRLDVIDIKYCPDVKLPMHSKVIVPEKEYIALDKKCFPDDIEINPYKCRLITLSDNSLYPIFSVGDRCIIDTSYKKFINNQIFAFVINEQCYLRQIQVLPDKIKCISLKEEKDTFYLTDTKDVIVLGLIIQKIRL